MKHSLKCPCASTMPYEHCCKRFHSGSLPGNAEQLMRSRFSAYALGDLDYIIKTTHPENPGRKANLAAWRKDLLSFSKGTSFDGLKIIDFVDGQERATVTFTARLRQGAKDASFTEKSSFEKVDGRWLYKSGEMQNFFS